MEWEPLAMSRRGNYKKQDRENEITDCIPRIDEHRKFTQQLKQQVEI